MGFLGHYSPKATTPGGWCSQKDKDAQRRWAITETIFRKCVGYLTAYSF